jgi:hypothetical protein
MTVGVPPSPSAGLELPPAPTTPSSWASAPAEEQVPLLEYEVLGYAGGDPDTPRTLDSAAHVPRSLVVGLTRARGWDR